jgi:hypothetical protein
VNADELEVRAVAVADLERLAEFRCSTGASWEDLVETQVRGPLPRRYLAVPPRFDGRMLLGCNASGDILVVGAHHIEPTLVPDVGYTEVIAVALDARRTLVRLPGGASITLGAFMLLTIFRQMRDLGRQPRTFVRVDRRNVRSLALCDRVGLTEERRDPHDDMLVQRWGELPE